MTQYQYYERKREVLSRFREEFLSEYRYDALKAATIEMLIRDDDPFAIIEFLIVQHKETQEKVEELIQNMKIL